MRHSIGIDPDSKDMAIAVWNDDGPVTAQAIHVVRKRTTEQSQVVMARKVNDAIPSPSYAKLDISTIAIEGQQKDKRSVPLKSLFTLAHTTGIIALWCVAWFPDSRIVIPTPYEWKKQTPKVVHQSRLYRDLGWGFEVAGQKNAGQYARPLAVPAAFKHITPGQWKHIGDAILLAKYAHEKA